MIYSVSRPKIPQILQGPGTIIAMTCPVSQLISKSETQPKRSQLHILMTSFWRSSQILIKIISCAVISYSYIYERKKIKIHSLIELFLNRKKREKEKVYHRDIF